MTRRPIIRTEAELYDWLLGYMRRTGRVRQYPKPLVELTDHLLDRILMDDIWEGELLKEFYGDTDLCGCCGGHFSGALHNLLEQMADNTDQLPCCSPLVVLAAEILRLFPAPIELRDVNNAAVQVLRLIPQGLLAESEEDGAEWLESTLEGRRKLQAHIEVQRDGPAWTLA